MVIIFGADAKAEEITHVKDRLRKKGFDLHESKGVDHTVIGVIGDTLTVDIRDMQVLPGVVDAYRISSPYKLVSREFKKENTVIKIKDVEIGDKEIAIMAGPCAVESEEQVFTIAESVSKAGAKILRGGAFKPRTSPYAFQGMGEEGLKILRNAADKYNMLVITEVMDKDQIDLIYKYTDIFQIGARNMQNFSFLKALGKTDKPIMLKRGISATIKEWLMSAEYILSGGNHEVMFCERGIRTYETYTRNTLDISAIPIIKKLSHLPIISDPSHGTGIRDKVLPMARASIAAGADGLMIEVHNNPEVALSDGAQSLYPNQFEELMEQNRAIAGVLNRKIANRKE
jgi:3-deoxy-7-phosphoheptulonate synthase